MGLLLVLSLVSTLLGVKFSVDRREWGNAAMSALAFLYVGTWLIARCFL